MKRNPDTGMTKFEFELNDYDVEGLFDMINKQRLKHMSQMMKCMTNKPTFKHPTYSVTIPYLLAYIENVDTIESRVFGVDVHTDMNRMVEFCKENNIDMYIPED